MIKITSLCLGIASCLFATPLMAQQSAPVDHSKMDHSQMTGMDHSKMDQSKKKISPPQKTVLSKKKKVAPKKTVQSKKVVDHSTMDHSQMPGMDHSTMDHSQMPGMDHSTMNHSQMQQMDHSGNPVSASKQPLEAIPLVTDADRAAAFPQVHHHHQHGTSVQDYSVIDRLEIADTEEGQAFAWEAMGWVGGDVQKFLWRTEGHGLEGSVDRGKVELLYGRGIRAWWDVVAGVRQDFGRGPERTWVGVGIQGLAPYKFETSATLYVGSQGRTTLNASAEYDTLWTNRLIMQWRAEANVYGKDDPLLEIGSGISTIEVGARLRYEINRKFAPYVGVEHERAFGRTADYRKARGAPAGDTHFVAGVRIWF